MQIELAHDSYSVITGSDQTLKVGGYSQWPYLSEAPPSVGMECTKKILAKNTPEIIEIDPFKALQHDTMT